MAADVINLITKHVDEVTNSMVSHHINTITMEQTVMFVYTCLFMGQDISDAFMSSEVETKYSI